MTTRPIIVLTGFEEIRTFIRTERSDEAVPGPTNRYLIFNDGAFKIPCDKPIFEQVVQFWSSFDTKPAPRKATMPVPVDIPAGAGVFSVENHLPTPSEDEDDDSPDDEDNEEPDLHEMSINGWAGSTDEAEDGVGQL